MIFPTIIAIFLPPITSGVNEENMLAWSWEARDVRSVPILLFPTGISDIMRWVLEKRRPKIRSGEDNDVLNENSSCSCQESFAVLVIMTKLISSFHTPPDNENNLGILAVFFIGIGKTSKSSCRAKAGVDQ